MANNRQKPMAVPGYTGFMTHFTREDVAEIRHRQDGENDERSWILVAKLKDGRWVCVRSWCDYTGWDCQSGVDCWIADSYEAIIRLGLPPESRAELGIDPQ